jgi:hypothetical protein
MSNLCRNEIVLKIKVHNYCDVNCSFSNPRNEAENKLRLQTANELTFVKL